MRALVGLAAALAGQQASSDAAPAQAPAPAAQSAPPAVPAGRADENAVRQAEDAFGTTIGRETIGIYSAGSVRGFSPIAAGNARIEGLYFDQVTGPNTRLRRSTSIKVGLSAQGYAFPAPTGVVDYALRRPGASPLLSATLSVNSFASASLELDGELPIDGDRLTIGGGIGLYANRFYNRTTSRQDVEGLSVRWRAAPDVEILSFYGRSYIDDDEIGPYLSPAGDYLPPRVRRDRFYGPKWADYSGFAEAYGVVATAALAPDWRLDLGLFNSASGAVEDIFTFIDDITPDGRARFVAFSDPPFLRASRSGEVRLTHGITDGPRRHSVSLSLRGRDRRERTGGSATLDFGPVRLGDPLRFAEPAIVYGPQNRDRVRQWSGGVAYVGRWNGVGELSAGLSRTDYRKRFDRPGRPILNSSSTPWLYNVAGAIYASDAIALYAGYTRGLEEVGLPPQNAANRNQALPAILTSQREAGLRWRIGDELKLVAGVFDVRKPYLSLDAANVFTTLGDTRNRGVEASLSGTPVKGLSVALGGVLLDPQVTGEARRSGRTGKRPVGVPLRSIDLNLDWQLPWVKGLSLDAGISEQGKIASTVSNSLFIPSQLLVDVGGRYRFDLSGKRATLRVSVSNAFNRDAFSYAGPATFDFVPQRQVSAYLAVDI